MEKELLKKAFDAGRSYQDSINPFSGKSINSTLSFTKWYNNIINLNTPFGWTGPQGASHLYGAPTQSLLHKWIREIHNTDIVIKPNLLGYSFVIMERYSFKVINSNKLFQTYEEALEEGMLEYLTNLKT